MRDCCRYQVLTDKGTLDAVGLSANAAEIRIKYRHSVWNLLEPSGLFIVTSCNSTAQELQVHSSLQLIGFHAKHAKYATSSVHLQSIAD